MAQQDKPRPKDKNHDERLLDESLEETFPASDPSSVTRTPKDKRDTAQPPQQKDGDTRKGVKS